MFLLMLSKFACLVYLFKLKLDYLKSQVLIINNNSQVGYILDKAEERTRICRALQRPIKQVITYQFKC